MGAGARDDFRSYAADRLAPLRRLAFLLCGDWHLAEDVVSTVMTKLYVAWPTLDRVTHLDAYVRTMVVRAVVDERRRPWRREGPAPAGLGEGRTGSGETRVVDDQLLVREALARMPARRRAVLVLRYYEGLSVEETATALGCSAGTVKSQTARALDALRGLLAVDGGPAGA